MLFKFEEEFYKQYGVSADFSGHPLLDIARPMMRKKDFFTRYNLSLTKTTIALLPGSRNSEVKYILPVMLSASSLIKKEIADIQFIIAKSTQVDWDIYKNLICKFKTNCEVIEGLTYDCLESSDFALVTSGTATLETAIIQKPFLIIYRMNFLNYLLYRPLVKLSFIGIVNIISGRKIIPEFIQFNARPEKISQEAIRILKNPSEIEHIKSELAKVKASLGEKGASSRAAQTVLSFLNNQGHPIC